MRSDHSKSLFFFKEFSNFYKDIGTEKIIFTPIYKYQEPYYFEEDEKKNACVLDKYCGGYNAALNVFDPSLILLENIRQKCLYERYYPTSLYFEKYWTYMMKFAENCADENAPDFTLECADKVFN